MLLGDGETRPLWPRIVAFLLLLILYVATSLLFYAFLPGPTVLLSFLVLAVGVVELGMWVERWLYDHGW